MSVKDCKDLPLELDSVVLKGTRGLVAIKIENGVAGAESYLTEITQGTLAIVSTATASLDSAIAFEAQDGAGAIQVPLYMTGSVVEITGALTINGVPFNPAGNENIEDVLTVGDDAGGLSITNLNDVGLVSINGTPYVAQTAQTITTIPAPVAGAGIASGVLHLAYQSAVYPAGNYIVNMSTDVFSTDHGAGILFSDGVIELRDSADITTAVYSNFSEGGGLAIPTTWAYGANLTLLWTSTGANVFQVYTLFTLTGASTYQVVAGGIVQVVKIA